MVMRQLLACLVVDWRELHFDVDGGRCCCLLCVRRTRIVLWRLHDFELSHTRAIVFQVSNSKFRLSWFRTIRTLE
jgi:hypothetical protein